MTEVAMQAAVHQDDQDRPYAEVTITRRGHTITVVIHESLIYTDTINVEIEGDLTNDDPSLVINLNDCLIHDSTRNDPARTSPRHSDRPDTGR